MRKFAKLFVLMFCVISLASIAYAGKRQRFVDTDDYKENDYDKGIIEDYSLLVEGDDIEWVYVAPGFKLSDYKIEIGDFKNMSEISGKRMGEALKDGLSDALSGKGGKGTLTTTNAIYWAERSSEGKRWIPYAGGHLAQAGVGVEMIFKDSSGKVVAMIRHSGREGSAVEHAAEELVDDLADYLQSH